MARNKVWVRGWRCYYIEFAVLPLNTNFAAQTMFSLSNLVENLVLGICLFKICSIFKRVCSWSTFIQDIDSDYTHFNEL